ncbi:MAG: GNAT family N-acetyltransferase [Paracoccaceae bacterium]
MTVAPTLYTERLTLRPHRAEDFAVMTPLFGSDWSRYMGPPTSEVELWRWVGAEIASWPLLGFGSWGIELTATGDFVGQVGINQPPDYAEVELGWCVWPDFEGKGIAFEAAQAARHWGFAQRGLDTLVSYIDPRNARSIALAERLGAVRDATAKRPDPDDLVYRHSPSEGRI